MWARYRHWRGQGIFTATVIDMIRKAIFVPFVAVALLGAGAAVAAATGPARAALPSSVHTYCDNGNRLYVSESQSLAVVPLDPTCSPVVSPTVTEPPIYVPPAPTRGPGTPAPTFSGTVPPAPTRPGTVPPAPTKAP